jgi:hypothetical protein
MIFSAPILNQKPRRVTVMKPGNFFRFISVMALLAIGFFSFGCTGE